MSSSWAIESKSEESRLKASAYPFRFISDLLHTPAAALKYKYIDNTYITTNSQPNGFIQSANANLRMAVNRKQTDKQSIKYLRRQTGCASQAVHSISIAILTCRIHLNPSLAKMGRRSNNRQLSTYIFK